MSEQNDWDVYRVRVRELSKRLMAVNGELAVGDSEDLAIQTCSDLAILVKGTSVKREDVRS